MALCKLDCITD